MAERSVKVTLGANVTGLVNGMRTAQRATQDYAKSATQSFRDNQAQIDQLSTSALAVGAGMTAMAGFAVKSAMDWEVAWTGVLKTVDGTPAQLAKVEDGLRSLATETGFAHSEVAAVGEAAGQLGISTGGIVKFTDTMLAMGVSTNLGAEEAATGLARFRNIMGSSEAEVSNMGSTIVALGNNFATTEAEILEMSMRLAGAGRQAGFTEANVMGVAAAMSSVGIEAEAGGTAMSMVMKRIGREVEMGGGKLDMFASVAGMTAGDFKTAWEDDAAGALTSFIAGLDETERLGKSTNAVLAELGITGIRESDALLRLSASSEQLADALGVSTEAWAQNISLMEEADKFYNTTAQKGKQAWAEIKDAAITAGDALLPTVAKIAEGVGGAASAFGSLPAPVLSGVTAIVGITGVSLLAVGAMGKLAGSLLTTMDAFDVLATRGGKGGAVISALGRNAARAAIPIAALAVAQATIEPLGNRGADDMRNLGKELEEFGRSGKVGVDLLGTFGKNLGGEKNRTFGIDRLADDLYSLGEAVNSFDNYADDGWLTRLGKDGLFFGNVNMRNQVKSLQDMDTALASLARSKPDAAIKTFEALRDRALETGGSVEALEDAFPQMTGLLQSASEAMGGTGDATELLNGNLEDLAPAAQQNAEELQKMQEQAQEIGDSFFDMGEALQGSLSGFGDTLDQQTEALASFRKNAMEALRKGADETLVDYLVSQGPEGAAMLQQLADATESEVGRISDSWTRSRQEVAEFVATQTGVPSEIVTEFKAAGADGAIQTAIDLAGKYSELDEETIVTVLEALDYSSKDIEKVLAGMRKADEAKANPTLDANSKPAQGKIGELRGQVNGVNNWRAAFTIGANTSPAKAAIDGLYAFANSLPMINIPVAKGSYMGSRVPQGFAGGGVVPGTPPANPRVDNVLAMGAQSKQPLLVRSGEWIINEKASNANDEWLRAINGGLNLSELFGDIRNMPAFADGGRLDRLNAQRKVRDLQRDLRAKERYGKEPKSGQPDRRPKRFVLRGLDRRIAQEELREAIADLRDLRKPLSKRRGTIEERREEARREREQRRDDIASSRESFRGNADLEGSALQSPAAVERSLARSIGEMATFTDVLIKLKRKGAAPWLLQQLQRLGPSRGTIRLAQQYLADEAKLRSTNALAARLDAVSGVYGTVTTDKRWEATKAWSGPLTSSQQRTVTQNVNMAVALDGDFLSREVARYVRFELEKASAGAVYSG